jgi:hypothetical protein
MTFDLQNIKQETTSFLCKIGKHNYQRLEQDERSCSCGKNQSYSLELCGWYDPDYLAGTNYDGGRHLNKLKFLCEKSRILPQDISNAINGEAMTDHPTEALPQLTPKQKAVLLEVMSFLKQFCDRESMNAAYYLGKYKGVASCEERSLPLKWAIEKEFQL